MGSTIGQSGFARYNKLLNVLCTHAIGLELSDIKGMDGNPILSEAEDVHKIRNKVVHQGYVFILNEMGLAKNIAFVILTEVVKPVLNKLNLVISTIDARFCVIKA